MLGGLLAGVTTCGVLMAIFQSNAGGAWDNAKKMIEEQGRKGTEAHKAAVVGDTVGDPFKDTSGPSLNILLKLMSVVALVIAPSIAIESEAITEYLNKQKDTVNETFHVEYVTETSNRNVMIANVELESSINEIKSSTKYVFKGTQKEVEEKVEALRNSVAENKPIIKI